MKVPPRITLHNMLHNPRTRETTGGFGDITSWYCVHLLHTSEVYRITTGLFASHMPRAPSNNKRHV